MLEEAAIEAFRRAGEREAAAFLRDNPLVVAWRFCWTGGHCQYVLNEFPLGSQYRIDLVVLLAYSGMWEVNLIELENTDDMIITKAGVPSKRLNSAISQIGDWREYIERNRRQVQADLSRWCVNKDLLGTYSCEGAPSNLSGQRLKDSDTYIKWKYHIVVGRREVATEDVRRKMNQYARDADIDIGTYGKFIDIAANLDRFSREPDAGVNLREWRT